MGAFSTAENLELYVRDVREELRSLSSARDACGDGRDQAECIILVLTGLVMDATLLIGKIRTELENGTEET